MLLIINSVAGREKATLIAQPKCVIFFLPQDEVRKFFEAISFEGKE